MKLDDDYFENRKMFDPIPEGIDEEEYYRQAKEYLARKRQHDGESIAEVLESASRQPRTAGRPKRDGRATIVELNSQNPPDVRSDRYNKRADSRGREMFELPVATRLQQYARARILTNKYVGIDSHPRGRKLRRIHTAYAGINLRHAVIDPLMEDFLEASGLPPVDVAKAEIKKFKQAEKNRK